MKKKKKNTKIVVKRHGYSSIGWIGMLSVIIGFITAIVFGALGLEDYIKKDKFFPDFVALFSFLFLLLFASFLYFYDIYYFTIESFEDRFEVKRLFRRKKIYFYKDLIARDYSWGEKYYIGKRKVMHISYIMDNGIDAIFAYKIYIESINGKNNKN